MDVIVIVNFTMDVFYFTVDDPLHALKPHSFQRTFPSLATRAP